jgi:non-ribosomal peptide synthetase component F
MGEEETSKLKRKLTEYYTDQAIASSGQKITPQQSDAIRESVKKQLEEKQDLFVAIEDLKHAEDLDISFYVTDETFDKGTVIQNLQQVLTSYRQFSTDPNAMVILRNIFDILGLDSETLMGNMEATPTLAQGQEQAPQTEQEGAETPDNLITSQENRINTQARNV